MKIDSEKLLRLAEDQSEHDGSSVKIRMDDLRGVVDALIFEQKKECLFQQEKLKLAPCDCKDLVTAMKLNEQGIRFNDDSLFIHPGVVILTIGHTEIKIPMTQFERLARWYLEEQELK